MLQWLGRIGLAVTLRGLFRRAISAARAAGGPYLDIPDSLAQTWQDSAGTIPAAIGSTVGLLTDRSFGGELGGELVVNGDFSVGATGWNANVGSFSVDAGIGTLTNTTAARATSVSMTTVAGRSYEVLALVTLTNVNCFVRVGTHVAGDASGQIVASESSVVVGMRRVMFVATQSTTYLSLINSASGSSSWDNISVRELKGNHATQATAGNRFLLELYNGHPMLRGNGASTSAQFAVNPIGPDLSQPYTIIVGGVCGALGVFRRMCGDSARAIGVSPSGAISLTHRAASRTSDTGLLSEGAAFVIETTWDGATLIIRLNGVLVLSVALTTAPNVAAGPMMIGQRGDGAEYWNGLLLPVFATNSVVPEAQRRAIARGMAQKLGVTYA